MKRDGTIECVPGAWGLCSHPDLSPAASSPPPGTGVPVLGSIRVELSGRHEHPRLAVADDLGPLLLPV